MKVFALPPGARFSEEFAIGFWKRFGSGDPLDFARIEILLNNRRSVRVVTEALARHAAGPSFLPQISVLAELGADPLHARHLPRSINPLRRQLRLTTLVKSYLSSRSDEGAPLGAAPDLAQSLAALLDEFDEAGVKLAELDRATEGEHAQHWEETLGFLDIVRRFWPSIAAEEENGAIGPKARQRATVESLIESWQKSAPPNPVIAAASTGSVSTTAELMAAVAQLPHGFVLLPGFDRSLEPGIWEAVRNGKCPEHPMAPFAGFLESLDLKPHEVAPWSSFEPCAARHLLFTQALRPAPVTDAWQRDADRLAPLLPRATDGLALVEAPTPRHEAAAIALATRRALEEPEKTVLILTADAGLARRINAELTRFDIEADDSLGRPLALTPHGVFLRLIAEIATGRRTVVDLAAFLGHPLCCPECDPDQHRRFARRYELEVLRRRDAFDASVLPAWPEGNDDAQTWLAQIINAIEPLHQSLVRSQSLAMVVAAHIEAATRLSSVPSAGSLVWLEDAGEAARPLFDGLVGAADALGDEAPANYPSLITRLMRSIEVRMPGQTPHPRVSLMSPRESRVASADLVILAGLNEGIWPKIPAPDPWLSRPMRAAIGLPPLERIIGLSAHDFQQAVMAPGAILTRSIKEDGAPTIPSRWLTRLEILLDGVDRRAEKSHRTVSAMRARGEDLIARIRHLHRPDRTLLAVLARAKRPEPRPPATARLSRISVTTVETLIRDPYAVYARRILSLSAIDPLGQNLDFRDRGTLIHSLLEQFTLSTPGALPDDAETILLHLADQILGEQVPSPSMRRIWRARIARFATWFFEGEKKRRSEGNLRGTEINGRMILPGSKEVTLTAVADRIDFLHSGGAAIYDYKAGVPPTKAQIAAGFNHQLHLQAAILAAGGFDTIGPAQAIKGSYIGLTGSGPGGKETSRPDLETEVAEHLDKVRLLLETYQSEETPFRSRAFVQKTGFSGDYDHLARFGEWEDADA
ncbi:MAG: double-strand break repair protein AddB [Pseudomonadota bacterium]